MATLVQRTPSMLSVEYLLAPETSQGRQLMLLQRDYSTMDADADFCRLFGSLNLTACGPFQVQSTGGKSQPIQLEDTSMSVESETMEATEKKLDRQSTESSPRGSASEESAEVEVEGCALIQMLVLHYAPRLSHLTTVSPNPNFNLFETILSHREAFVAFPYVHQTCSSALTKVAFEIERRYNEGGPFSEAGDIDTAIALHNEAWLMSGWHSI